MARIRTRVCLQDGLSLNLSWLAQRGFVQFAAATPERQLRWCRSGLLVAAGCVSADMSTGGEGWLQIWVGPFSQRIALVSKPRNFGGRQWYFECPSTGRLASVIWKPPGASCFASRYAWSRQVAYLTQFASWIDRAHLGKAKVAARLIGSLDPEEWELPPRPKGMHFETYKRLANKFGAYQDSLNRGLEGMAKRHFPND
jgi:hypothetical protein